MSKFGTPAEREKPRRAEEEEHPKEEEEQQPFRNEIIKHATTENTVSSESREDTSAKAKMESK